MKLSDQLLVLATNSYFENRHWRDDMEFAAENGIPIIVMLQIGTKVPENAFPDGAEILHWEGMSGLLKIADMLRRRNGGPVNVTDGQLPR